MSYGEKKFLNAYSG